MSRIICSPDLGSSEKLNLDRSSGDESMEDDVLESKKIDSTYHSDEPKERSEKSEMPMVKVEYPVVVHEHLFEDRTDVNAENKKGVAENAEKRSLTDPEAGPNSEPSKRQRRWKPNNLMEPTRLTLAPSTTPIDILQPTLLKCYFSVPDANAGNSGPKECTVPPSTCGPTNSLRIDHFLRPFTLKAVHELLGKTGTVTSFWMDHIKTHCYVTYSSVEAAIKTRNAVYNLQWPPNGGRLLVAEFVDPEDVKLHAGAPFQPLATPISADLAAPVPSASPPQPSPQQANIRQPPLPAQPALPPPVIPNPPQAREWILAPPPALPLPPPLAVKLDPPTVTLDDLFRKTKAAPRIYYLPLAEEQVSAKQEAWRRNTKQ
ncbi:hypothetical protein Nepgr_026054 [Nepenthes gracilis]|uniref:Uncharacterized protein n=1 Tax=Nepenthes gracilis TaxID=150966 RepID=A0AAD3Y239_NEPGR|nr:hypothetical protein Nepgr_026054 [Nepenthes gracilis]